MPYLIDNRQTAPIIATVDVISPYIIAAVAILIFLFFTLWIVWLTGGGSSKGRGVTANVLLLACGPGECGTNMQSGEKRCPVLDTEVVLIDPSAEVCNPRFACTNPLTPFALAADGSTDNLGNCERGTICRCLKVAQCPTYVASVFSTVNGTLFNTAPGNRFTFSQVPLRADVNTQSVSIDANGAQFCGIKTSRLNRLSPGSCTFSDNDYQEPRGTLLLATNCINSNPCVIGTMALDTNNPTALESNGVSLTDIRNIPVTCVKGLPSKDTIGTPYISGKCDPSTVPYWDARWSLIRCAVINYETVPPP